MAPGLPVPLSANRRLDVAESGVAAAHGQRRRGGEGGRGIAHAPLDDSVRRARRRHTEGRLEFDNNSITSDITIN